jgi:hypothetical protein
MGEEGRGSAGEAAFVGGGIKIKIKIKIKRVASTCIRMRVGAMNPIPSVAADVRRL